MAYRSQARPTRPPCNFALFATILLQPQGGAFQPRGQTGRPIALATFLCRVAFGVVCYSPHAGRFQGWKVVVGHQGWDHRPEGSLDGRAAPTSLDYFEVVFVPSQSAPSANARRRCAAPPSAAVECLRSSSSAHWQRVGSYLVVNMENSESKTRSLAGDRGRTRCHDIAIPRDTIRAFLVSRSFPAAIATTTTALPACLLATHRSRSTQESHNLGRQSSTYRSESVVVVPPLSQASSSTSGARLTQSQLTRPLLCKTVGKLRHYIRPSARDRPAKIIPRS